MNPKENISEKRCVIVGGAAIRDYGRIREMLKGDDYYIFCDSGLAHMDELSVTADLVIGDFDSANNPGLEVETIVLPVEKDDTDTFYAAKEAVRRGFDDFLLIGAAGARLDHTLANISILLYLDANGKRAVLADDYSDMEIVSDTEVRVEDDYRFFSLLAVDGDAAGVSISDAKYELDDAVITARFAYAVSNEALPERTARISVDRGRLLLVKVIREQ